MTDQSPKFVESSFGKIAYRTDGVAVGVPLILLQRYRGSMDDWDPDFIEKLSRHRHLIRFDSVGVGLSDGDTPDTVARMAEVARAFIQALNLTEVDLLGWSLGGYVASVLTLSAPDLVRRLIIAGSGPGGVKEAPPADPGVGDIVLKPVLAFEDYVFLFSALTKTSRLANAEPQRRIDAASTTPPMQLAAAKRQWSAIGAFYAGGQDIRSQLPALTLPVLVANGTHDLMIPSINSFVISQEAPNAKLVLYPDAGHGFLFQYADAFVSEVQSFLA